MNLTLSPAGEALIKKWEGLRLVAYLCPTGHWTIGWGHTFDVYRGDVVTLEEAQQLFDEDIQEFVSAVNSLVKVPVTQGMFDALVSFAFNIGIDIDEDVIPEGLGDSALLKKLNAGDYAGAANQFLLWDKGRVNGELVPLAGLTARRHEEHAFFLGA
jgi:lysozyme